MLLEAKKQRIPLLDYAKVIAMFLVVLAHLYDYGSPVRVYIYAFHMPLFFLVSGMLHKFNGSVQWEKYLKTLVLPAAFYTVLMIILATFMYYYGFWSYEEVFGVTASNGVTNLFASQLIVALRGFVVGGTFTNQFVWFLLALFWMKVFCDLLSLMKKHRWIACFLYGILFAICFIIKMKTKYSVLWIGQALMCFPFFYLGFLFRDKIIDNVKVKNLWGGGVKLILCLVGLLLLTTLNGKVSAMAMGFGRLPYGLNILVFYLNACLGIWAMLGIASLFKKHNATVEWISKSLISVLGFQYVFTFSWRLMIGGDMPLYATITVAVAIIVVCALVHSVVERYCPLFLGKKIIRGKF